LASRDFRAGAGAAFFTAAFGAGFSGPYPTRSIKDMPRLAAFVLTSSAPRLKRVSLLAVATLIRASTSISVKSAIDASISARANRSFRTAGSALAFYGQARQQTSSTTLLEATQQAEHLAPMQAHQRTGIGHTQPSGLNPQQ
jgi:hypothetical protein